ncbi:MAG: protein kinase, partial [Boseongicola sp.]|nr:protein kinase [Boseongicola sp.]
MADNVMALPSGFRLQDYEFESVLASGESSIKYIGIDRKQQRRVAIEEFLPAPMVHRDSAHAVIPKTPALESSFKELLKQFLTEAETLSTWHHPNIVEIHRSFRANGTGYAVMDFVEGQTLSEVLRKVGTVPNEPLQTWLQPLLGCLESMHGAGLQHQHIRPGNIVLNDDGSPILLARGLVKQGFSAARQTFG